MLDHQTLWCKKCQRYDQKGVLWHWCPRCKRHVHRSEASDHKFGRTAHHGGVSR